MPQLPTPATGGQDVWGNTLNGFLTVAHDNTATDGGKVKPSGILPGTAGQVLTTTGPNTVGWQNSTAGAGSIVAAVNFQFVYYSGGFVFGVPTSGLDTTQQIFSSLNVSSVINSLNATEPITTINFTNPLPDANYFVSFNYGLNGNWMMGLESKSTTSIALRTRLTTYADSNGTIVVSGIGGYTPATVSLIVVR
ncbi:MAG: hypothetical protein WCK98_05430 [bacterium]